MWIPVENSSAFVRIEGYYNGSKQSYLSGCSEPYKNASQEEKDLYTSMYISVTNPNNKGFYMGRYEAGKENNKVVVKKNEPVYNAPWSSSNTITVLTGGAVELAKNFTNDKPYKRKVTSTLVYGVQWDTTLKFFNNENYLKDSTGKGHYSTSSPINTGTNQNYKIKNVYDMAGNVWEWTMEADGSVSRVMRGGSWEKNTGTGRPASNRVSQTTTLIGNSIGFRLALYVNV